jgi:hypothetical protein
MFGAATLRGKQTTLEHLYSPIENGMRTLNAMIRWAQGLNHRTLMSTHSGFKRMAGPSTMVLAEFEVPARTSGKDWFVVITPRSVILGVGSAEFTADFMQGDGYVTLGDANQVAEASRSFTITSDYSKWYQYVGNRFDKVSGIPGYSWIGIMSMGSVMLRVPDSFASGSLVSMRLSTTDGGMPFPMPGLIELQNPLALDVAEASTFFASSIPEPSKFSHFLIGIVLLEGIISGRRNFRIAGNGSLRSCS